MYFVKNALGRLKHDVQTPFPRIYCRQLLNESTYQEAIDSAYHILHLYLDLILIFICLQQ